MTTTVSEDPIIGDERADAGPAARRGPCGGDQATWAALAAADPCSDTVAALDTADPAELSGAQLIDAIVACEKSISHLHAIQATLTAAFARPGVPGDATTLVNKLCEKRGAARGPDGQVDPDLLQAHIAEFTRSLAAAEIAAALHIPHRTAATRIDDAGELVAELPAACQALRAGRIDQRRARVIADGTRCLNPGARAAADAAVTPLASDRLPSQLAELLERAVIAADPDAAHAREQQAHAERNVRHLPGRNGMGKLYANLPAEAAAAAFTLIDLLAQATAEQGSADTTTQRRGIDARRADAMADIFTELLATGRIDLTGYGQQHRDDDHIPTGDATSATARHTDVTVQPDAESADIAAAPCQDTAEADVTAARLDAWSGEGGAWRGLSRHGRRPHLIVTVGLSTLAGLDRLPGQLAGHGAITAELARNLAEAHQTVTLLGINSDTGTAGAVSHTIYRARQQTADQIAALAGSCRFPSCRQPADQCDIDHRVPFDHADPAAGGKTNLWDCDPQCRRHHLFKTHAHWLAEGRPDRCIQFTSPTGHSYLTRPHEYTLPGETTDPDLAHLLLPALPPPRPAGTTAGSNTTVGTGDTHDADPVAESRFAAQIRHYQYALRVHQRQLARYRAVGHRLRHLTNGDSLPGYPAAGAPPRDESTAHGPGDAHRRRLNRRDRTAANAIEWAIRIANGEPDPADEPPPF